MHASLYAVAKKWFPRTGYLVCLCLKKHVRLFPKTRTSFSRNTYVFFEKGKSKWDSYPKGFIFYPKKQTG